MALNTQPCYYVKTVTTTNCSVLLGAASKTRAACRSAVQRAQRNPCASPERVKPCRAKCMPVTNRLNRLLRRTQKRLRGLPSASQKIPELVTQFLFDLLGGPLL